MTADVIDFPDFSFTDNEVNGAAVIFNIEPVTNIQTIPVNRKGLSWSALIIISGMSFSGK